ncbi:MAG: hypothetical protein ABJB47_12185 [Actinomycetota bacterium]
MHRTRAAATCLVLAAGLGGSAATFAPGASASARHAPQSVTTHAGAATARPAEVSVVRSWRAAQRAAGFDLRRPGPRAHLRWSGLLQVAPCNLPGLHSKITVTTFYGAVSGRYLAIGQNNSATICTNFTAPTPLGNVRVQGVEAHMFGTCGAIGLPSCDTPGIFRQLYWTKNGIVYSAGSHGVSRRVLISFARGLHRVH